MFESKTIGDAAFAAPPSTSFASAGGLPNLQIPSTFNATQEFAALWHFFYKFMESLTHLRWFEDELWRRLDVCSHADPGSMFALIDMMAMCSARDRVDARNLFLVWKLCSMPTRVAFSRYADAWLRGLRTSSLPEDLPGGQFQAPPEVAGSFETAALVAGLIYGAVAHVDAP